MNSLISTIKHEKLNVFWYSKINSICNWLIFFVIWWKMNWSLRNSIFYWYFSFSNFLLANTFFFKLKYCFSFFILINCEFLLHFNDVAVNYFKNRYFLIIDCIDTCNNFRSNKLSFFSKFAKNNVFLSVLLDQKPPRGAGRAMLFYESS